MNFNQLVIRNVLRNGREYLTYFLSSLFSVMVFFIFSLLYFHPDLGSQLRGSSDTMSEMATFGITVAEVVIALMSFVFLWYAFSAFLQTRKPQLSVYLTLGMSEKKLRKMIVSENLVLGFGSILVGTLAGITFSKLILLISQNILAIEEGLAFYFPWKAILLTWVVYAFIFLFISLVTILKLRKLNFIEMKYEQEDIVVEPKTSVALAVLGVCFILVGYVLVFGFVLDWGGLGTNLITLLACVLITILGTFLFFKYASVRLFYSLRNKNIFFRHGNMLTISNLMQRMKSNATMYFMIAIVGAIAFVGIGVSKAIGSYEFGSTQADSFAVVYTNNYGDPTEASKKIHAKNIKEIEQLIEKEAPNYLSIDLNQTDIWVEDEEIGSSEMLTGISESTFNQLLTFEGKEPVDVPNGTVLKLARTNSDVKQVKKEKLTSVKKPVSLLFQTDNDSEERSSATLTYSEEQMAISRPQNALAVVSDATFEEIKKKTPYESPNIHVFQFNDWQKYPEMNKKIAKDLSKKQVVSEQKLDDYFTSINKRPENDLTESEIDGMMAVEAEGFYYSTMYKTWLDTKQKNGTILLISVLLGSVFFTFSCSIIYFKLFSELEKDGKYHRSLYILGVPEKRRRKMVTVEMLIMFFMPFVISSLHFVVAMSALKTMVNLPVYQYVGQILIVYIIFQVLFFLLCRRQYVKTLNKYAENIKR